MLLLRCVLYGRDHSLQSSFLLLDPTPTADPNSNQMSTDGETPHTHTHTHTTHTHTHHTTHTHTHTHHTHTHTHTHKLLFSFVIQKLHAISLCSVCFRIEKPALLNSSRWDQIPKRLSLKVKINPEHTHTQKNKYISLRVRPTYLQFCSLHNYNT